MAYIVKDSQGKEASHNGKQLLGFDVVNVIKEVDMEKRILRIVATDETPDRDGDIIRVKGWRLENYLKNPVFIWSHDYRSVPLAAAIKVERKRSPWRIVLSHRFPTLGLNPFADMILNLYNEKIINAGSVGFIPDEWKDINPSDLELNDARNSPDGIRRRVKWGREYLSQELLEHSGCAIPANPSALQESVKSMAGKYKSLGDNLLDLIVGKTQLVLDEKTAADAQAEIEEIKVKGLEVEEELGGTQVQVPANYSVGKEGEKEDKAAVGDEPEKPAEVDADEKVFEKMKTLFDEVISQWFSESVKDQAEGYKKEFERLLKAGAVLNRKNKTRLKQAAELIQEVLSEAEPEEEEDESGKVAGVQDQADLKDSEGKDSNGGFYDSLFEEDKEEDDVPPESAKGEAERIPLPKQKPQFDAKKLDAVASMIGEISKTLQAIKR